MLKRFLNISQNIYWFQLLKGEDFLLFAVCVIVSLIFFLVVDHWLDKTSNLELLLGLWKTVMGIFHFYSKQISDLL